MVAPGAKANADRVGLYRRTARIDRRREPTLRKSVWGDQMKIRTVIGVVVVSATLATSTGLTGETPKQEPASVKAITLHQELNLEAPPQQIYEALLDGKQFAALSGAAAEINTEAGSTFSLFGGRIVGRNVELVKDQRIVQAWRPKSWPEGVYSIVRFELKPRGQGTHLVFDHVGFPEGEHDHLAQGWENHYWKSLRKCSR
jgi:activator of HSP90 ATPase